MTAEMEGENESASTPAAWHAAAPPDLAPINRYGRRRIRGFEDFVAIRPIGSGYSNPTYRVDTASGGAQVLRAMPARRSAMSAHRIDREYRVINALRGSAVPVPRPIHYCDDAGPIGTPFYLMAYVPGPVFVDGDLPDDPAARRRIYLALAECLGRLHAADYRALGLSGFGMRSGDTHFERQVATMTRLYRDTEMGHEPVMERLIALLGSTVPAGYTTCLVHGDFRLGNMVVRPDLSGIAAVLDWELSTLGDPLTDVGYCTLMYHWDSPVFGTVIGAGEGIPEEGEFLETYCRMAGRSGLPDLSLYQAFSLFRLACITQAALHREAVGQALARPLPLENHPASVAKLALDLAERSRR
ncbi:phosphotransferase family protein [Sphingopyxis lindanitolerans]|uniref:Phosphotransferase family protein n=1 Tax=Sphingopyxis lindanitolerans TaxID=2054227 RepID=A0A2S8B1M7_9SPHN|nr:phosphotransferase family protein [Sphingopyxis lindanitolerans]PQM26311.1 phosphotransferase family protein [Sphingopyxis lindanitolerans]